METLEIIGENSRQLRDIVRVIERISNAFYMTGNTKMADDLLRISEQAGQNIDAINDAYHSEISASAKRSEEATNNMVRAAISAIAIK